MYKKLYLKFVYFWHILSWIILFLPLRTVFKFKISFPQNDQVSSRPLLVAVNHKSIFDPWFFTHTLTFRQYIKSAPMHAVAAQRFNNSFLNLIYYLITKPLIYFPYGVLVLPLPKDNTHLDTKAKITPFKKVLESMGTVFIFPEGHLYRYDGIHEFKRGVIHLQRETNAPILLASIRFIKRPGFFGSVWWLPWVIRIINWDKELTYIPKNIISDDKRSSEFLKEKLEKLYYNIN